MKSTKKSTKLLSTTAAALLIGAGIAAGQGTKSDTPPERAPPAQRGAPAEKIAPPMNAGERKAPETTGQNAPSMKPGGDTKPGTTDQAPQGLDTGDVQMKNERSGNGAAGGAARGPSESSGGGGIRSDRERSGQSGAAPSQPSGQSTTGQGAATGAARLTTEQRSKITTIIKEKKVAPVALNISVRVGARIPPTVRFYPLPVEVIEIYPEWRGYQYILVGGDIIVIDPNSHEIVAIIAA